MVREPTDATDTLVAIEVCLDDDDIVEEDCVFEEEVDVEVEVDEEVEFPLDPLPARTLMESAIPVCDVNSYAEPTL